MRSFLSSIPKQHLRPIQKATVQRHTWKGVHLCKDPFDLALYQLLLWELQPKTIIEVGTKAGGSALWFRDQCRVMDLGSRVVSIDSDPSKREVNNLSRVRFVHANIRTFPGGRQVREELEHRPHPWLVIEDSDHYYETVRASADFFLPRMETGDYLVIEDGVMETFGNSHLYNGGPNRVVEELLAERDDLAVDYNYCDYYGTNVTWSPNGWLKKVR